MPFQQAGGGILAYSSCMLWHSKKFSHSMPGKSMDI
jgi:hypothetical protein